jgi:HlyD family type I secretion membrane fusion protein
MMDKNENLPQPSVKTYLPSIEVATSDEGPPSYSVASTIKTGIAIISCFILGVVVWCIYVPMGAAISAPGEVVFLGKRQSVQHLEGGIVKAIFVKDGDLVKAGQPLIELEQGQVQPIVQMLEQQDATEIAQTARLEAESRGASQIVFPAALTANANNPDIARVIQNENRLFAARRAAHGNQVQLVRLQISQLKETIKGIEESLSSKKQEIATIKEQLAANQALQKDGYVARSVILDIQRQLSEKNGQRDSMAASLASERQRIHEMEQRIASLNSERVQGTMNELKQSATRRLDLQERIRPVKDTLDRQVIKAPVMGKVVGLKVSTIGGVIMPRDTIMEIAPLSDQLVIEAKINVEDVNQIKVGQKAEVRISGLDAKTLPPLPAEITYVSADRIVPAPSQGQQAPYFAATLKLDEAFLKKIGKVEIMPGMNAQVAIAVKSRTAYNYVFEPLFGRARKAIHAK